MIPPGGPSNPFADPFRFNAPISRACSLSHGLSFSFLSSLNATWQHGRHRLRASASGALEGGGDGGGKRTSLLERFPLRAACTASGLALTGDSIAQLVERFRRREANEREIEESSPCCRERLRSLADRDLWQHDFPRALRMASYGFLLYGPGSYAWYQWLDRMLPAANVTNFALKVTANQVLLGPCVLVVVFAWNLAWMGKAREIPDKYRRDFVPSMLDGWKFWIPAACLNFAVIPLEARVAFMSTCAIFWNFYLSSSVGRDATRQAAAATSSTAAAITSTTSITTNTPAAAAS